MKLSITTALLIIDLRQNELPSPVWVIPRQQDGIKKVPVDLINISINIIIRMIVDDIRESSTTTTNTTTFPIPPQKCLE
jgi:hypothetical protein